MRNLLEFDIVYHLFQTRQGRRFFLLASFVLLANVGYALIPVAVAADPFTTAFQQAMTGLINTGNQQNEANFLTTISNLSDTYGKILKVAQDADQVVLYEQQAAKALSQGTWQGFTQAFDEQTQASQSIAAGLGTYTANFAPNNPSLQYFSQEANWDAAMMAANNGTIQQANVVSQLTAQRLAQTSSNMNQLASNPGGIAATQLVGQQLGIMSAENADTNILLQNMLTANAVTQNKDLWEKQAASNYYNAVVLNNGVQTPWTFSTTSAKNYWNWYSAPAIGQ